MVDDSDRVGNKGRDRFDPLTGSPSRSPSAADVPTPTPLVISDEDSYSPSARHAVATADAVRRESRASSVASEMILYGLVQKQDGPAYALLRSVGVKDPQGELAKHFGWGQIASPRKGFPNAFTNNARAILETAGQLATRDRLGPAGTVAGRPVVRTRHIVRAILQRPESQAFAWLSSHLESRIPLQYVDQEIGRWPADKDFTVAAFSEAFSSLLRPVEEQLSGRRSVGAGIELRLGQLTDDPSCDLLVLPCSTAGTFNDWVQSIIRTNGLKLPSPEMRFGAVSEPQAKLGRSFVYAASVRGDASDGNAIREIGRRLGDLSTRYSRIGTPLLGAGKNRDGFDRIPFEESFRALRDGFLDTAVPGSALVVLVPEQQRYEALRVDADAKVPRNEVASSTVERDVVSGFSSDAAEGNDLLDIKQDVDTLCAVIAARDVAPPLSIGLFGDWGIGKSFFIGKMKERLEAVAAVARSVPQTETPSSYCEHITQIEFNAWRYIDTDNLWASLAEGIIDGLARELDRSTETTAEQRARLLAAATRSRDVLAEAEDRRRKAQEQLTAQEDWLARLRAQPNLKPVAPGELRREAALIALEKTDELREAITRVANQLSPRVLDLEEKAELLQMRGARWLVAAVRSIYDGSWTTKLRATAWAIASAVVLSAVGWLASQAIGRGIAFVSASGAWLLTQAMGLAAKVGKTARTIAAIREKYAAEVRTIEDSLSVQREKAASELSEAELRVSEARRALTAIEAQLDALRADRLMAKYVRERHASDDYRKHLGVIARARADFEQLSKLLIEARTPGATGQDDLPRIDRIVLYIDDLDRCDERQVVSVLQAVHLLLAFELFVVVVAVDSRWLLHSLEQHSRVFAAAGHHDAISSDEEGHWRSTPMNYLEKIFQIPFALTPMDSEGFGRMVDDLMPRPPISATPVTRNQDAATLPPEGAAAPPQPHAPDSGRASQVTARVADREPVRAAELPSSAPAVSTIDPRPDQLRVEPWETAFMKHLHVFIESPRAAKRFVNLYRLLRASVPPERLSAFRGDEHGGDYRAAMILLAVAISYPIELTSLIRALRDSSDLDHWWPWLNEFMKEERRRVGDVPSSREILQRLADLERDMNDLIGATLGATLPMCDVFHYWARRVARFSFHSGRLVDRATV